MAGLSSSSMFSTRTKLTPFTSPPQPHLKNTLFRPKTVPLTISSSPQKFRHLLPGIRCGHENSDQSHVTPEKPKWENVLSTAASLYPLYVTVGGVISCLKPYAFAWFVNRDPVSYSLSLGLIMLAMGPTLELKDLLSLFMQRPLSNTIKDHTIEWIEKHYPGLFQEIHFGNHFALDGESKPKSEICRSLGAKVLIDDNPTYAIECAEVGIKVLLFDYENSYPWCKTESVENKDLTDTIQDFCFPVSFD